MPKGIYQHKATSEKTREKMSASHKLNPTRYWLGKHRSNETKIKIGKFNKGKIVSNEQKRKISKSLSGDKCYNWKGGISSESEIIRKGIEFRLWREAVFARDNWTCQKYHIKGRKLHPHHIQNFAQYPELRFAIDNGITFSDRAHYEFHKKYGYKNNTQEQLNAFLKD